MWRHAAPAYGFECRDRDGRWGERRAHLKGMGRAARNRARGDREGGVRRGPAAAGGSCPAVPIPPWPMRPLCPALPELRPWAWPAALAGLDTRRGASGAGSRCAARPLFRARGGRRGGAVARHDAGHTRTFDDQVVWLAVQCSKTAVTELMRIAWRTVGAVVTRVSADLKAAVDRLRAERHESLGCARSDGRAAMPPPTRHTWQRRLDVDARSSASATA